MSSNSKTARLILAALNARTDIDYAGLFEPEVLAIIERALKGDLTDVRERLEELRAELQAGDISYGELAELQSLAEFIKPGDVELLEAAGVPEDQQDGPA